MKTETYNFLKVTTRQILNNSSLNDLNLVLFSFQEKKPKDIYNDLKIKYDDKSATALTVLWAEDSKTVLKMLESAINTYEVRQEQKKQQPDKSQPYKGQILSCVWGYDARIITYYQVIKYTKCFVWLKELNKQTTEYCAGGQTMERPIKDSFRNNEILRRKIQHYSKNNYSVKISSYQTAAPWNGKDLDQDTMD